MYQDEEDRQLLRSVMNDAPPVQRRPADALLDGRHAVIRPVSQLDESALLALHDQASDESLRLRFFSTSRAAGHTYIRHVLSDPTVLALTAELDDRVVALATAERVDESTSEIALLVADQERGNGLGALLLEHLAAMALSRGILRFEVHVLEENHAMLALLADAGYGAAATTGSGTVLIELATGTTQQSLAAMRVHQ